jgi:hypothetical protein
MRTYSQIGEAALFYRRPKPSSSRFNHGSWPGARPSGTAMSPGRSACVPILDVELLRSSQSGATNTIAVARITLRRGESSGAEPHTKGIGRSCLKYALQDWMSTPIPSRWVAELGGEVRGLGVIPNRLESVRKVISKLGEPGQLKCCYEAGPTGYLLYWQLTQIGVDCEVIAPSLVA